MSGQPRARARAHAAVLALLLCAAAAAPAGASANDSEILIVGGMVVNADRAFRADVRLRGGRVAGRARARARRARARVLDATGRLVLPGGVDPHTHLAVPFMGATTADDFFSGQAAALAGGTTFRIDFPLPVDGDLVAGYTRWRAHGFRKVRRHLLQVLHGL
jgi:hypothetical protein